MGLRFTGVSHAFGSLTVLESVAGRVGPGELLCLLGPSGCGKTTLLRLIAGLEPMQAGEIHLDDALIASPARHTPPEARRVGMVFQDYALFPHLSVCDNVAFGMRHVAAAERRARARDLLGRLGLAALADSWPHRLSGGQQQRVALARALAPAPRLMLLDEPFSGLDARLRQSLRDETLRILQDSAAATVMVTHDPEEAMFMADRILLMDRGRVVQQGSPADLYFSPATLFAARFFGEINEVPGRVEAGVVVTPLGAVAAPGLASGMMARVAIRPEALVVDPGGVPAQVSAARLLGGVALVHVVCGGIKLQARLPGYVLPQVGSALPLRLDPHGVHIFPEA